MRAFDYKCLKCGQWTEAYIETERVPEAIYCECGGVAQRRWRKGPGIVGDGGFHSAQLGKTFSSRSEFNKYCKDNNLEVLGTREWHHTQRESGREDIEEKERDEKITQALEESWQRVIVGKQSVPQMDPIEVPDGIRA